MAREMIAGRADRIQLRHFIARTHWPSRRNPPLSRLMIASHLLDKWRGPRRFLIRLASQPHFVQRIPRRRSHKTTPRAAMHLRIVGRLKRTPHVSPHGLTIGVTMHVAALPSQPSAVGIPSEIHGSDCDCGTANSTRNKQSGRSA